MKLVSGLMAILLGMCLFTSCGSDDDDPETPSKDIARQVAGRYTGDLAVKIMGQDFTFQNLTFTLTATADDMVSVVIPGFSHGPGMTVTDITVPDVRVTEAESGAYTLQTTEFSGMLPDTQAYTGSVKGKKSADGSLDIDLSLKIGAMPMPMVCTFHGI